MNSPQTNKLLLEMRRGAIVLATLSQLRQELYGYSLRQRLAECGLQVDEGTLYPLIRRLEQQGLLVSEWRTEDKRRKRFYQLSSTGSQVLDELTDEWESLQQAVQHTLEDV